MELASSWSDWCRTLEAAGQAILSEDLPEIDKAEGLRWITRLARQGLEAGVEFSDPASPAFYMPTHETVKVMSDNPDALHYMAAIRDDGVYRLHGIRGGEARIMFTTLGRKPGGGLAQQAGIDSTTLQAGPDGSFTLHICRAPQEGNWLPMAAGAQALLARVLLFDRQHDAAPTLRLEEVGGAAVPMPLSPALLAARLDRARQVTQGTTTTIRKYVAELRTRGWINRFGTDPESWAAGDPGVQYLHGMWRLAEDEALVIDLVPPDCFFWNLQVNNVWAESLDYLHRRIHINAKTARRDADGRVRAVIARRDPGVPNWLNAADHGEGTMLIRAIDAQAPLAARCRPVRIDDIKEAP